MNKLLKFIVPRVLGSGRRGKLSKEPLLVSRRFLSDDHNNPVVTISDARTMPKHYNEMPGSLILTMAINGELKKTFHARCKSATNGLLNLW